MKPVLHALFFVFCVKKLFFLIGIDVLLCSSVAPVSLVSENSVKYVSIILWFCLQRRAKRSAKKVSVTL